MKCMRAQCALLNSAVAKLAHQIQVFYQSMEADLADGIARTIQDGLPAEPDSATDVSRPAFFYMRDR